MASNVPFNGSLGKRRSNSSPQLHCEATDISSIVGVDLRNVNVSTCTSSTNDASTSSWTDNSDLCAASGQTAGTESGTKFRACNVTQASVHWLEPKQRAVLPELHNGPLVVKPKARLAGNTRRDLDADVQSPNPDLLRCNETIHYLQGSDSESDACQPEVHRRKSHAGVPKRKRDSSHKFKRLSKVASQILSKLKLQETKGRTSRNAGREANESDDSDSESEQPVVRRRSRSLTSRVLKRFGPREEETSPDRSAATTSQVHVDSPIISGRGKLISKPSIKASTEAGSSSRPTSRQVPLVNFAKFDPEKYPIECTEEIERAVRQREIEEGIVLQDQAPPVQSPTASLCAPPVQNVSICGASASESGLTDDVVRVSASPSAHGGIDAPTHTTENIYDLYGSLTPSGKFIPRTVHTQIDYMHCLVPDQWNIMKSSFYWGKIDRYEADSLLENKPEGTFLLRDSAQEEFLFSVSFCRYGRTLHARIEQWNHKFSFDAHDPGVYSSDTICGLLEHYKDPSYCMFFEPMLTNPLPRVNPPSLLELSRARICTHVGYDSLCYLKLPNSLKEFLREYHYKQRVRIRRVEVDMPEFPHAKQTVVTNTCISR